MLELIKPTCSTKFFKSLIITCIWSMHKSMLYAITHPLLYFTVQEWWFFFFFPSVWNIIRVEWCNILSRGIKLNLTIHWFVVIFSFLISMTNEFKIEFMGHRCIHSPRALNNLSLKYNLKLHTSNIWKHRISN